MNSSFPMRLAGSSDPEAKLYESAESSGHGGFPVGRNGFWHGGVHLTLPGEPVRAIADGVIVAYRLDDKPVEYEGPLPTSASPSAPRPTYSSGFVLIKHCLKTPLGAELAFYSLYAHLKPMTKEQTEARAAPGQAGSVFEKTDWVIASDDDGGGMPVVDADVRESKGIIPFGARFTVHPADGKCKDHRYRRIRRVDQLVEGFVAVDASKVKPALTKLKSSKARILDVAARIVDAGGGDTGIVLPKGGFFTQEGTGALQFEKVECEGQSGFALIAPVTAAGKRKAPATASVPVVDESGADAFSIPAGKEYRVLAKRPAATSTIAKWSCTKVRYPDPQGPRRLDGYAFLRVGYDVGPLAKTDRDQGNLHTWGNDSVTALWSNEILDDHQKTIGKLETYHVFELLPDEQVPANHWTRSVGWRKVSFTAAAKQGQPAVAVEGYAFVGPHAKPVPGTLAGVSAPDVAYQLKSRTSAEKVVQPPKNASIRYTEPHGTSDRLNVEKRTSAESRPWAGTYNGLAIKDAASDAGVVTAVLALGTPVRFKDDVAFKIVQKDGECAYAPAEEKYRELSDGGFLFLSGKKLRKQAEIPKPITFNSVVCPNPPVPVRRGEVLGWPGGYVSVPSMVHVEVFAKDHAFASNPKKDRWGPVRVLLDPATRLKAKVPVAVPAEVTLPAGASLKIDRRSYAGKAKAASSTFCHVNVLKVTGWIAAAKLLPAAAGSAHRTLAADVSELVDKVKEVKAGTATTYQLDANGGKHPIPGKSGESVTVLEDKGTVCKVEYARNSEKSGWVGQAQLLAACKPPHLDATIGTYWYELRSSLTLLSSDPARANRFEEPTEQPRKDAFAEAVRKLQRLRRPSTESASIDEVQVDEALDKDGNTWLGIPSGSERGWVAASAVTRVTAGYDWLGWEFFDEGRRSDDPTTPADESKFSDNGFCDIEVILNWMSSAEGGSDAERKASHERLRRLACLHPSEWDGDTEKAGKKYELLKPGMAQADFDKLMTHISRMHFWQEVSSLADPRVWHFHPIGFAAHLRKLGWLTRDQLLAIFGRESADRVDRNLEALNDTCQKYQIDTPLRIAHFLSQVGIESGAFRYAEELDPNAGANYEGRKDLGNLLRGDGARFIGRGFIQLTGRAIYEAYEAALGEDITSTLTNAQKLRDVPRLAADSAGWYWTTRALKIPLNLNLIADNGEGKSDAEVVLALTRQINGGVNGLGARLALFQRAKSVLCDHA